MAHTKSDLGCERAFSTSRFAARQLYGMSRN